VLLIAGALGLVLAILAALGLYGAEQLTRPKRCDLEDTAERWGLPEPHRLDLRAMDGVRLSAWWFHHAEASASVIVAHGHGGNKESSLWVAAELFPRFNVLLLDLRGHGQSEGVRTTIGYEERLDVHAAVDLLVERGLGPVGVFGMSMGAATAILAAAEDERIAAVVADSPYGRLRWAIAQGARLRGYPAFIAPLVANVGCRATALHLRFPLTAFDPLEVVHRIGPRPLLLIHGVEDEVIPVRSAHALYSRAAEPKELWLIDGLKHCRALDEAYDAFKERVVGFFERHLTGAAPSGPLATGDRPAGAAALG
jgi:pimeloyl-ACP methyl ester carboxylesterase